jgi:DNA-binding response OmpR family regulator
LDLTVRADDADTVAAEEQETILIVEDNADMRLFIQGHLGDEFHVIMSTNGREGLAAARHDVPDLIITDLMMPVMDGMAFCAEIRKDERTSHITARGDRESKLGGLETGADDYLTKPFDAQELAVRVRNLLVQRKQLRRKFSEQIVLQPKDVFITSRDSQFLEKMERVIEENLSYPEFGAAQMQDALTMSKTQLHRKMKALTDQSPGDYLRVYRLKRAAQLLEKQNGNITETAFATGFASQSYFTKAFKAYYGQTPSEYLKQARTGQ